MVRSATPSCSSVRSAAPPLDMVCPTALEMLDRFEAAGEFHYEAEGLPNYSGYGTGYRMVKSYLEASRITATRAIDIPWQMIIQGSSWL